MPEQTSPLRQRMSVAYGAGLRVSEVVALKVSDIDSTRMMIRVEQGTPACPSSFAPSKQSLC